MYKVTIEATQPSGECKQFKTSAPLLSELYIQLPKPQSPRKFQSLNNPDNNQLGNYGQYYLGNDSDPLKSCDYQLSHSNKMDSNYFNFSATRTKNSSQSQPTYRSQSQIIQEWVKNLFQKKNLLGTKWEDNFNKKRKQLMKQAFKVLKEEIQPNTSAYLQTQSKHKPYFRRQHPMVALGVDKMIELSIKWASKLKRAAFSKLLRHIAFQSSNSLPQNITSSAAKNQLGSSGNKISLKQSKIAKEMLLKEQSNSKLGSSRGIGSNGVLLSPRNIKNQDYQTAKRIQIKQVQSAQHLPFSDNQYALTPASPIRQPFQQTKKPTKIDVQFMQDSKQIQQRLTNSRPKDLISSKAQPPSPGGTIKCDYPQHRPGNYIIIQPQYQPVNNHNLKPNRTADSRYINVAPPSPTSHQYMPNQNIKFMQAPINFQPISVGYQQSEQMIKARESQRLSTKQMGVRGPNYMRPHSHNPFITLGEQNNPGLRQAPEIVENGENRKSRAVSASPNIKISFMGREVINKDGKQKISDYQGDNQLKANNQYKLGTAENKKIRQSYQIDSFGNQLLVQDLPKTPQTPQPQNYFYSTPASPRPQQPYRVQIPQNQLNPNHFGKHSYMPARSNQPQISQQMRQSMQPNSPTSSDYNLRRFGRQKLTVTSAHRRRPA